jgi:hypothetical protein
MIIEAMLIDFANSIFDSKASGMVQWHWTKA